MNGLQRAALRPTMAGGGVIRTRETCDGVSDGGGGGGGGGGSECRGGE